jgi:hypothetical protein
MVKILAFDTETNTMLIREKNSKKLLSFADYKNNNSLWSTYINICPSIIQLSYILYDMDAPENSKVFNKYIGFDNNDIINNDSDNINIINKINQCSKSQQLDNGTTVAAFIILLTVLIFAAHKHHDDSYKSLRTNTTNAINNIVINRNKYDSITKYTNKQSSSSSSLLSSRLIF